MVGLRERALAVWSGLQGALRRSSRRALLAAAGALVIMVVCVSLLIAQLQPNAPARVTRSLVLSAPTSTQTTTPTDVPTLTPTRVPTQVPVAKLVPTTPPPPPVPTPPLATPTVTYCPTATPVPPTPTPTPTATATPTPTPTSAATATATAASSPSALTAGKQLLAWHAPATCTPCPVYIGNNPSQPTLRAALDSAADAYHLPRLLVEAVAWQESKWHEDVTSCDGGLGLMQIQWYYVDYFNGLTVPECNLSKTSYDANTAAGNAMLGAKVLAYNACFFSYWGGTSGASLSSPGAYTIDAYYQQAGLPYPDTSRTPSLCATVYNNISANPWYQAMSNTISTPFPWPCQYDPTKATDSTLLDVTLSAYNAGAGAIGKCGCIPNPGYVSNVEYFIPQFANNTLPTAS